MPFKKIPETVLKSINLKDGMFTFDLVASPKIFSEKHKIVGY